MKRAILLSFFELFPFIISAQSSNLNFRNISINSGLSDSFVLSIEKDGHGFIWVGTSEGLNRYDGYSFQTFRNHPEDTTSLSSSTINALHQGSDGNLYIGTEKGLNIYDYDSNSFREVTAVNDSLNLLNTLRIRSIHEYNNSIYLGTLDGLISLDRTTMHLSHFKLTSDLSNKMANEVICLAHDSHGMIWLGTYDGLYRYSPKDNLFERFDARRKEKNDISNNLINALFIPDNTPNLLYIGGPNGLMVYDVQTPGKEVMSIRASDSKSMDDEIKNITQYNDTTIVLGTENGLTFYNTVTKQIKTYYNSLSDETSIPSNHIKTSFRDKSNGIIWFGTENGLTSLDLNKKAISYTRLTTETGTDLLQKFISHDLDIYNDELWLASRGGVRRLNSSGKEKNYSTENGLRHKICKSLFRDSKGTLWVGTNNGLNWYDQESDTFKSVKTDVPLSAPLKYIYSITEDSNGNIVTNISSGLLFITPIRVRGKVTGVTCESISISGLLQSDNCDIGYIEADHTNGIWFSATMDGLFHYDRNSGKIRNFKTNKDDPCSLISNRVYSIFADKSDIIWIGTDLGLCCYLQEQDSFLRFDDPDLNQSIRMINSDQYGRIWISTNSKLILFNPQTQEKIVCNLKAELGVDEISYNSSFISPDGEMWIGCDGGYVNFNPQKIIINKNPSHLVIHSLSLWDNEVIPGRQYKNRVILPKSIIDTDKIILKHNENSIKIAFTLLNFSSTDNTYVYALEGYDKNFRTVSGKINSASYSNLAPGRYIFHLKACNSDNIWSKEDTSLDIRILQPLWNRWWAWCLYLMTVSGGLFFVIRNFRMRMILSNELKDEKLERVKLEELNDIKMRFFTNVSHDFRTPLSLILGPIENLMSSISDKDQQSQLHILQTNAKSLQRLIEQIMDIRKIENSNLSLILKRGDIVSFVSTIYDSFKVKAKYDNITFSLKASIPQLQLDFDSDKTEKILFNLLSNAFKFTPKGGEISINLKLDAIGGKEYFVCSIKDTGVGIQTDELKRIFERFYQSQRNTSRTSTGLGVGLTIVKECVELQGGTISVESTIGKGSTFTFTIPTQQEECLEEDNENSKSVRVLIVEDNKDMRDFIRLSLKEKFDVYTAHNGASGFSNANEINPDVIISDIVMPEMDGYELCRKIKSDARTSHIPVILLSAMNDEDSRKEGYLSMADGYISKPFSVKTLFAKIEMLIEQRKRLQDKFRRDIISNPSEIRTESEDEKFISNIVKAIEDNIDNSSFGIKELCDITKWSHQQVYRKIRALTGETINEFIRTIRLKRAAQLLSQKGCRVSTVMYDVGFNSHSYFTKCFKDKYGLSPKEYAGTISGEEN